MSNKEIAAQFALLGKLLEVHGGNAFRAQSYGSLAFRISRLPAALKELSEDEIQSMPEVGKGNGEKVIELLKTGGLTALKELLDKTPAGVLEMLKLKGLGPKKIQTIWKELGIEDIGELEYACMEHRLSATKGFGKATENSILEAIGFYRSHQGMQLYAHVEVIALMELQKLREVLPARRFELAGALRRQVEVLSEIEIVATATIDELKSFYKNDQEVTSEESNDETFIVRRDGSAAVHFFLVNDDKFLEKWFLKTGSDEFVDELLNGKNIPSNLKTEEELFAHFETPFIPAPLRESCMQIEKARKNSISELIQPSDIKGIIHCHSRWSDGAETLEKMAKAAMAAGYEYLVISDHSQAANYANGLTPERTKEQHAEIDVLNKKLAPFKIFKSIEADILSDGELDYDAEVLSSFDMVIASVHSNLRMSQEKAMQRLLKAIANPYTTILGHPTGRLLLSRPGYPIDHEAVIRACVEAGVVIEMNANPRRLDMDWRWIERAVELGAMFSIDPDAHSIAGMNDVRYGVLAAQKGGLTKERNLSSFSRVELEAYLQKRRGGILI
jgi:DNA polymerase (family 10)